MADQDFTILPIWIRTIVFLEVGIARRAGWFALLIALVCGAAIDLAVGGQWFQHGSPIYHLYGMRVAGFDWKFLYLYTIDRCSKKVCETRLDVLWSLKRYVRSIRILVGMWIDRA